MTPDEPVDGPDDLPSPDDSTREGRDPARPASPQPAEDEGDFSRMLEASLGARAFEDGETVEGTVIALWPDVAFLDIGGKSEATIDIEELKDEDGEVEVEVGDRIQAVVVSTEGGLRLSRKLARGAALEQGLSDAWRTGLPVEGKVERAIKGGYDVRVAGRRAFCPISQIDLVRTEDPAAHEGQVYAFRIVEYKDGGKNLVVSRRALLEEEARERAEEVRRAIVPDAVLAGRVVSLREYGAFIDLGAGVQGLLHVSEMGWGRVADPSEVVRPGDSVTVKVLRVEPGDKGKISLGLKQLSADPWERAGESYAEGRRLHGRITRLAEFGAFVELEPGIEALAHASTFPPTATPLGWQSTVPPGTVATFEILTVDLERRRIGVARVGDATAAVENASAREAAAADARVSPEVEAPKATTAPGTSVIAPGARLTGKVDRHERYGVFVFLAPGKRGLLPAEESGFPRGTDLRKALPRGSDVDVIVLEVDPAGRRIRLSRQAVLDLEEKRDARAYEATQASAAPESFGSLAEKLRAALGRKNP